MAVVMCCSFVVGDGEDMNALFNQEAKRFPNHFLGAAAMSVATPVRVK
jgi:hypothetical protein